MVRSRSEQDGGGDAEGARTTFREALARAVEERNAPLTATIAHGLMGARLALGDVAGADACARDVLPDTLERGTPRCAFTLAEMLASVRLAQGRAEEAARLLGFARVAWDAVGQPRVG